MTWCFSMWSPPVSGSAPAVGGGRGEPPGLGELASVLASASPTALIVLPANWLSQLLRHMDSLQGGYVAPPTPPPLGCPP